MNSRKIAPNVVTYNSLIHGLSRLGQWKQAISLFEKMSRENVSPGVHTFTILVDSLCKAGRLMDALKMFEAMSQFGAKPDVVTYTSLIMRYAFPINEEKLQNCFMKWSNGVSRQMHILTMFSLMLIAKKG
ncbi:hypothetical protein ACHQM5_014054 [Ranunculus cassubicifolius]